MKITEISHYTEKVHKALNVLLPQLSDATMPLASDDAIQLIASKSSHLLMAEHQDRYIGMLTLVFFRIPSGMRVRIEDLVVDDAERGQGVGRMLIEEALTLARELGAGTVSLTSNPSRKAANTLYQNIGFQRLKTNVYLYKMVQ